MRSSQARALHPDRPIPLPAHVRVPSARRGLYAITEPDDAEVPVWVLVPVSAAELAECHDLRGALMRAGAPLPARRDAPSRAPASARLPSARARYLRLMP